MSLTEWTPLIQQTLADTDALAGRFSRERILIDEATDGRIPLPVRHAHMMAYQALTRWRTYPQLGRLPVSLHPINQGLMLTPVIKPSEMIGPIHRSIHIYPRILTALEGRILFVTQVDIAEQRLDMVTSRSLRALARGKMQHFTLPLGALIPGHPEWVLSGLPDTYDDQGPTYLTPVTLQHPLRKMSS